MSYLELLAAIGDLALIAILPAVVVMARILWVIKVNDLPHLHQEIIRLQGKE